MTNKPNPVERVTNVSEAKVVEVIRVEHTLGSGVAEDPFRAVVEWYELDGRLIHRHDSWRAHLAGAAPALLVEQTPS